MDRQQLTNVACTVVIAVQAVLPPLTMYLAYMR